MKIQHENISQKYNTEYITQKHSTEIQHVILFFLQHAYNKNIYTPQ